MENQTNHKIEITTNTIAELYIKQGYIDKALDIYRAILELDPSNDAARIKIDEIQKGMTAQEAEPIPGIESGKEQGLGGGVEHQIKSLEGWLKNIRMLKKGEI